jgi:acetyl esterase
VNIGLENLIDEGSIVHVEESRRFYAAKQAAGGQRGPANYEELKEARANLPAAPGDARAVERIARAGKASVPARVTSPSSGESRATYLDIHGGGFYMDSAAAGNDLDLRVFPESMHGFTSHPTSMAKAALEGVETWLASRLEER